MANSAAKVLAYSAQQVLPPVGNPFFFVFCDRVDDFFSGSKGIERARVDFPDDHVQYILVIHIRRNPRGGLHDMLLIFVRS